MLVPSCFHGLIKDVKRECTKVARKLLKGKSLDEAFAAYEMLDTRDFPGSVLQLCLNHQFLCEPDDFHFPYLLWSAERILMDKLGDNFSEYSTYEQRIFEELLKKNWSVLCLGGDAVYFANLALVYDEHSFDKRTRWFTYIKAVLKYWNEYVEMGNVFDDINPYEPYVRHTIWEENTSLRFVLGNLGLPDEVLKRPLPGMDLKKLLDDYGVFDVDISSLPWKQGQENIPVLKKRKC